MFLRRLFPCRALWSWYKSFPLSALSVHRKSILHFEKTIIPGHLFWVRTIVYNFNSLFYCRIAVCADQPAACLPGTQLWALPCPSSQENLQIQCAVFVACSAHVLSNVFAWYKVFRYPFPLLRIIPAFAWEGRTCLCPVVFAVFLGPPLMWPGKKEGWECILQAIGKKMPR